MALSREGVMLTFPKEVSKNEFNNKNNFRTQNQTLVDTLRSTTKSSKEKDDVMGYRVLTKGRWQHIIG